MPGTITISTLSDGTNSTSATNPILGSAKAWANWNGSTAAIRASYNVGSITKNSTGNYTINFTNALQDTNYCVVGQNEIATSTGVKAATYLTASVTVTTALYTAVDYDTTFNNVAIFR